MVAVLIWNMCVHSHTTKQRSLNLPYTDHKIVSSGYWKFDPIKLIFFPNLKLPSSQMSCFNQRKEEEEKIEGNISSISFSIWPNCTAAKHGWAGSQQRLLGNRVWSKGSLPPLFPSDPLKHTAGLLGNSETQMCVGSDELKTHFMLLVYRIKKEISKLDCIRWILNESFCLMWISPDMLQYHLDGLEDSVSLETCWHILNTIVQRCEQDSFTYTDQPPH